MASNEGHIHWGGASQETVTYLEQVLSLEVGDEPVGVLEILADGFQGAAVLLPNSTNAAPVWDDIPGTLPVLQVRQDGHYPIGYIRIRQA